MTARCDAQLRTEVEARCVGQRVCQLPKAWIAERAALLSHGCQSNDTTLVVEARCTTGPVAVSSGPSTTTFFASSFEDASGSQKVLLVNKANANITVAFTDPRAATVHTLDERNWNTGTWGLTLTRIRSFHPDLGLLSVVQSLW